MIPRAVVTCLDSRVPAEIVFDVSIGDAFTGRVAGNVVNDASYQSWIGKRDTVDAVRYTSERLYQSLDAPSAEEKAMEPPERIRKGLEMPLRRIPDGPNLPAIMSG